MAFAREIIQMILQWIRFRIPRTEDKDSYYGEIGGTLIRISNHCTRLRVWDDMLEKNPKWKGKPIISIVFEDDEGTFNETDCLTINRYRKNPIKVYEYVYNLNGNPNYLTKKEIKLIIASMQKISNGSYEDKTGKCQNMFLRVSQSPNRYLVQTNISNVDDSFQSVRGCGADYVSETKTMKNQTVKLTESKLRNIIAEALKYVLGVLDADY